MLTKNSALFGSWLLVASMLAIILANLSLYSAYIYKNTSGKNFKADQLYTHPGEPLTTYDFLRFNIRDKATYIFYFISLLLIFIFAWSKNSRPVFWTTLFGLSLYPLQILRSKSGLAIFNYNLILFLLLIALCLVSGIYCLAKKQYFLAITVLTLFLSVSYFLMAMLAG